MLLVRNSDTNVELVTVLLALDLSPGFEHKGSIRPLG